MDSLSRRLINLTLRSRAFSSRIYHSGNITRHNFWRELDRFKTQIQSADFVAIDLELSGVHSIPRSDNFAIDSNAVDRCYRRLKHLAEKFAVLQVGVALFEWDKDRNKFLAHPYNFYLFPRNELQVDLPGSNFSCAASSLEFLACHGFDFNQCFQDGISYLSKTQEAEARLQMTNSCGPLNVGPSRCTASLSSTSDVIFFEKLRVEVGKWHKKLETCSPELNSFGDNVSHIIKTSADISGTACMDGQDKASAISDPEKLATCQKFSQLPSLTLILDSHRQVHLAQLVVEKHFQDLVVIKKKALLSDAPYEVTITFTRSREDLVFLKNDLEQGSHGCEQDLIHKAIGFRHVIDAIVTSRKPLVGHNCALDLAHIYSKFISPLPTSVKEFSASILQNFPSIIDTKYLLKFEEHLRVLWARRQMSLSAVHSYLCKPKDVSVGAARFARGFSKLSHKVEIEIGTGFKRYQDTENKSLHEAGYDAFMTGSVFAQICHLLHVDVKSLQSLSLYKTKVSGMAECINVLNFGRVVLDLRTGNEKEVD